MSLEIRQIAFARESGDHYRPFWRVDFEVDGKRQYQDVQAQNVIDAKQSLCRDLGVPFSWP